MSSIFNSLFGGTDTTSQDAQLAQNQKAIDLIARNTQQAREDALRLFPAADESRNLGFQSAFELLGGTAIPQQVELLGGGNVGAQNALLAGLPQIQNAILGNPTDLGALQSVDLRPQAVGFEPFAFRDLLGGLGSPSVPTSIGTNNAVSFVPNAPAPTGGGRPAVFAPPRLTERPFNPGGGGSNN